MGLMRKCLLVALALACAVVLSSCAGLPFGLGLSYENRRGDSQMGRIAAAVNSHDVGALKAVFSPWAVKKATDLDKRLDDFLAVFPNGGLTWKRDGNYSEWTSKYGRTTKVLKAFYIVSAEGKDYNLSFADFTVNDLYNRDNVGIYGLGMIPLTDDRYSGIAEPFYWWTGRIRENESKVEGYPGVYVGYSNSVLSSHKMDLTLDQLNHQDPIGLRDLFSKYVRREYATTIDDGLNKLVAFLPGGDVVLKGERVALTVREKPGSAGKTTLLLSTYRVSSGGTDYRFLLAQFTENAVDPSNVGIYAIGVAPWTELGDSAAEKALSVWSDSFTVDASTAPGIHLPQ